MDVEQEFTHPTIPGLRVYASTALAPGQGIHVGDKLFLSPQAVHELRKQAYAMSNNKVEATFHNPEPSKRELRRAAKRAARRERTRKLPLPAKIGAAVLLAVVLVVVPVSCIANGNAYQACVDKAVAEAGFDAPTQAILDGCR